ncbi:nucleotidyltransferase family protein [Pedobacter jamesrossensis]|uniref:NTP transferase domain-containing protein n=1 Tax=Pedobacter jamesrossensis TaxID=1908238 RepID=A0ABV8NT11_9SPHI
MSTGIIILAAGNSSRLGSPKQLLHYEGKTLLERVSFEAIKTLFKPIVVVLGAYAEEIGMEHKHANISYTFNKNWQSGMASSIAKGLSTVLSLQKNIENVIITVSDQVFVSTEIFQTLVKKHNNTSKGIIACRYEKTNGTPTLFNKKYFEQLLSLSGTTGAKKILIENEDDMTTIPFEKGYIDVDTRNDYNNLINNK